MRILKGYTIHDLHEAEVILKVSDPDLDDSSFALIFCTSPFCCLDSTHDEERRAFERSWAIKRKVKGLPQVQILDTWAALGICRFRESLASKLVSRDLLACLLVPGSALGFHPQRATSAVNL